MERMQLEQIKQAAFEKGNTRPVFVYGTLMQGQRANHLLSGSDYAGIFRLDGFSIYHLGSYPGIVPGGEDFVLGELYFVSEEMITQMDRYEREGELYLRKTVLLKAGQLLQEAQVYVYNRDVSGFEKMNHAWHDKLALPV